MILEFTELPKLSWEMLVFFSPAFLGNGSPVLAKLFPESKSLFRFSIDAGLEMNKQALFGKNKTWFGLFLGVFGGALGSLILLETGLLNTLHNPEIKYLLGCWYFGAFLGLGAMLGDLAKSFLKRRIHLAEGKRWFYFDQVDFVVGSWLISCLFISPEKIWIYLILGMFIIPPLHLLANWLAFKFKLKKVWW